MVEANDLSLCRLESGEIHVWYAMVDRWIDSTDWPSLLEVLSPEEHAQYARFRFDSDRYVYGLTHGMLRVLLCRYGNRSPSSWTFLRNEQGRPEIEAPPTGLRIRFNISHTKGMAVCAFALEDDLGVDVENVDARNTNLSLVERSFSDEERAYLSASKSTAERKQRFFAIWTLKESYIKARGLGLAVPLDGFTVHPSASPAPTIAFHESVPDDPSLWQLWLWNENAPFVVAAAVRRKQAPHILRRAFTEID